VSAATQIYEASFDAVFVKQPPALRARIEQKIDEIGLRPQPIHTIDLKGRIGTAPVSVTIGSFTLSIQSLLAIGHRREIYRDI
jgi:hypothetical protein